MLVVRVIDFQGMLNFALLLFEIFLSVVEVIDT